MIFYIVAALIALIVILLLIDGKKGFDSLFLITKDRSKTEVNNNSLRWLSMQNKKELSIKSFDKLELHGSLYQVNPGTNKVIIAVHRYMMDGLSDMASFARFYRNLGYDFLLIDSRGHGKSQGKYTTYGVLEAEDCLLWVKKIIEIYGDEVQIALHGISMGAASIINMTALDEVPNEVKAIIADSSYAMVQELVSSIIHSENNIKMKTIGFFAKMVLHADIFNTNPLDSLRKTKTPILFIHGEKDSLVPVEVADRLYEECESRKWIFKIPNANHGQAYVLQPLEYEKIVTDFLKEYIEND